MKKTYISPQIVLLLLNNERILLPATVKVGGDEEEVNVQYSKQNDLFEEEPENDEVLNSGNNSRNIGESL